MGGDREKNLISLSLWNLTFRSNSSDDEGRFLRRRKTIRWRDRAAAGTEEAGSSPADLVNRSNEDCSSRHTGRGRGEGLHSIVLDAPEKRETRAERAKKEGEKKRQLHWLREKKNK